jgi:hypothetical protein
MMSYRMKLVQAVEQQMILPQTLYLSLLAVALEAKMLMVTQQLVPECW